jgi:nucleoside-diphosphate-sugar epimerase
LRVLVVGGTRFIGVATVELLLEHDHAVVVFNRGTRSGLWPGRVRELRGDRTDRRSLVRLASERFDGVVDFCAYRAADVRALLAVQGGVQRHVHISSGTVYALEPRLPWREETPYGPAPLWGAYARGKIESEQVLRAERDDTTATTAIRPPWVLGAGSYADRERFVLNRLLDREEILLPGDGKAVQQFVTAGQVAHAVVAALEAFDEGGWRAFNVASPGYASLEGFVEVCAEVVGVEPFVRPVGGGATGTGAPVFEMASPVFPFPNENYLLDTTSLGAAGLAPAPVALEAMIGESLAHLVDSPERRWSRSPAERELLGGEATGPQRRAGEAPGR